MRSKQPLDPEASKRILAFALIEGAFILLVTLPVLLWLFVFDNGLTEAELTRYAIGIVVLQVAVSGLLLWKLRILPGNNGRR